MDGMARHGWGGVDGMGWDDMGWMDWEDSMEWDGMKVLV